MKQHFMSVYNYSTKNRAHAEFQEFVNKYQNCLADDIRLAEIIDEFKAEIQNLKEKFPRCDLIRLETWSHEEGQMAIAVSGNFNMSVTEVRRFELNNKGLKTNAVEPENLPSNATVSIHVSKNKTTIDMDFGMHPADVTMMHDEINWFCRHKFQKTQEAAMKFNAELAASKCKKYDIIELQNMTRIKLDGIALALDIDISGFKGKQEVIYAILDKQAEQSSKAHSHAR